MPKAVVLGAGMVGLGAIIGCKLAGAKKIIAVDLSAQRLELAKQYGATHLLKASEDPSAGSA